MNIKIASAQYPITNHTSFSSWEKHIESWISEAAAQKADLLLFPEYGAMELVSLFSPEIQQDINLQLTEIQALHADFQKAFSTLSTKYNVIIVAPSFPVAERGSIFNRAYVYAPNGTSGHQDKFFMTRFENETWGISAGPSTLTLFETVKGNFGIQICYDVEFAIGSAALASAGADFILAPSCSETLRGATRVHIGARARAMENQFYTIVSQTVGNALWSPAVDINYGFTGFYSTPDKILPEEGIISTGIHQDEGWNFETLDLSLIEDVRRDGQVLNFKDHQQLDYRHSSASINIVKVKLSE